jgi:hypothetical protein
MTPSPRLDDTSSVWLRMFVLRYKRMLTATTAVSDYWERVTMQPGFTSFRYHDTDFGVKEFTLFLG